MSSWIMRAVDEGSFADFPHFGFKRINSNYRLFLVQPIEDVYPYSTAAPSPRDVGAVIVLLDLTQEEGSLCQQARRWQHYSYEQGFVYFVGTRVDLLPTQNAGWNKLTKALRPFMQGLDYRQHFVTSSITGNSVQACIDAILQDILRKEYTVENFIQDYQEAIRQRLFPHWLYPSCNMQRLIANHSNLPLNFHTIISQGGHRTRAVLKAAGINSDTCLDAINHTGSAIVLAAYETHFHVQWYTFLCCVRYKTYIKKQNDNHANDTEKSSVVTQRIYVPDSLLQLIFQFAAPDISTLNRVNLLHNL